VTGDHAEQDATALLTPKGRATRARVVAAAARLVYDRGVGATSIDEVRRAAGVSGSQMTHYFGDKRSLIRAVIGWQADNVIELHRQPDLGQLDSLAALRRWAELNVERQQQYGCRGGCRLGSLAGELAESDPETRADLAAGFQRWQALLRRGLTLMRDRGELRPDADPDQLAYALLAALQGGMLLTQLARDPVPLTAALRTAIAQVESFVVTAAEPEKVVRKESRRSRLLRRTPAGPGGR